MSAYIKARADQKRKINKEYNDKLFVVASHILPAVIIRSAEGVSEVELVDNAVLLARSLLAELGYKYRSGASLTGEDDET